MSRNITLGPVVSYREWLKPDTEMTTGDELALERLDCERGALRAIIVNRPHKRLAALRRLRVVAQEAADIARRYR